MAKKNQLTTSDYLEYDEYIRLLKCLHLDYKYVWELYAILGFSTACRASDILNMRWKDFLGKNEFVVFEKKTRKSRPITINQDIKSKLHELYKCMGSPDQEGYCISKDGKEAFTIQWVNRRLKEFKKMYNIQIKNFSSHTFRKTFGRYVYEHYNRSAEGLMLLNKILNHSNIEVTKTYIGITQDEIDNVFNSLKI